MRFVNAIHYLNSLRALVCEDFFFLVVDTDDGGGVGGGDDRDVRLPFATSAVSVLLNIVLLYILHRTPSER